MSITESHSSEGLGKLHVVLGLAIHSVFLNVLYKKGAIVSKEK